MARTRYSDAQRTEALNIYATEGAAEAARRTGIPGGTIAAWASRTGASLQRAETTAAATAGHQRAAAERMARTTALLAAIAETGANVELAMLERGTDLALRDVVGARTRAVHDYQLLAGEATSRSEVAGLADRAEAEERLAKLIDIAAHRRSA